MTFNDGLTNRDFTSSQEVIHRPLVNMPAAPPSNFQGFNTMPYNPMMSAFPNSMPINNMQMGNMSSNNINVVDMANMNMGFANPYQQMQAPFMPNMVQNLSPQMYGMPMQSPGMSMIPGLNNSSGNIQFPSSPPRNFNNSALDDSFEREDEDTGIGGLDFSNRKFLF